MKKSFVLMSIAILITILVCGCGDTSKKAEHESGATAIIEETPEPAEGSPEPEYEDDKEILEASSTPVYQFSRCIKLHDGTIMTTTYAANNGGIRYSSNDFKLRSLPASVEDIYEIAGFTVYNNRIYFLAHEPGSVPMPGGIYSCDMNGGDMVEITRNACNYSECYIKDGYIYYDGYKNLSDEEPDFFSEGNIEYGIYKANLQGTYDEYIVPKMSICSIEEDGIICEGIEPEKGSELSEAIWRWTDLSGLNMEECQKPSWLSNGRIRNGDGVVYFVEDNNIIARSDDGNESIIKQIESDGFSSIIELYRISPYEIACGIYSAKDNEMVICQLMKNN